MGRLNPAFAKEIYNVGGMNKAFNGGKLTRGYIEEADVVADKMGRKGKNNRIDFLWNPSTVSLNYTATFDKQTPETLAENDTGSLLGIQFGTLEFSLLFDRTFEIWQAKGTPAAVQGVAVDIDAFRKYVGLLPGGGFNKGKELSVMAPIPSFFGFGALNSVLYYGWMTGFNVQITHFTQGGIPMRAAIGVTATLTTIRAAKDISGATTTTPPATGNGSSNNNGSPKPNPQPGPSPTAPRGTGGR